MSLQTLSVDFVTLFATTWFETVDPLREFLTALS